MSEQTVMACQDCGASTVPVNPETGRCQTCDVLAALNAQSNGAHPPHATHPPHDNPHGKRDVAAVADVADIPRGGPELAELLGEVEATLLRYVVLPGDTEVAALTLWVAHTHAIDGAHATPYLLALSPEKRSGKTRLLEVVELLVARAWRVTSASDAAMFRKIGQDRPTLLLDEIDAIFNTTSERTEALRSVINAGNRPGASVARCVGEKGETVKDFAVYCPKVLAGIDTGRLPDTIRDRGITIELQRKTAAEQVERFRHRDASAEAEPLAAALSAWGETAAPVLLEAEPEIPAQINDRAAEAWEPLVAIAELAGEEWASRARVAALSLSGNAEPEDASLGTRLLGAVHAAFDGGDALGTTALLDAVNGDDELPFGGWREGKGLDARTLARLLRPYKIRSRTVRLPDGATPKGYKREQFADAWARYLPAPSPQPPQAPHPPQAASEAGSDVAEAWHVADGDNASTDRGAG